MTKRQDLCLQRRSRPEQSDQRQPDQAANISHQPRASPNSTSLASRIEFPTMTAPDSARQSIARRRVATQAVQSLFGSERISSKSPKAAIPVRRMEKDQLQAGHTIPL